MLVAVVYVFGLCIMLYLTNEAVFHQFPSDACQNYQVCSFLLDIFLESVAFWMCRDGVNLTEVHLSE